MIQNEIITMTPGPLILPIYIRWRNLLNIKIKIKKLSK